MVGHNDQTTLVYCRCDNVGQPLLEFISELTITPNARNSVYQRDVGKYWHANGVVPGIDCNDAPVGVLQTKETRLLPQHVSLCVTHAQSWEEHLKVSVTIRIHLMISIQREAAAASEPPCDRIVI